MVDALYADFDLETDFDRMTLCADCAKHPSLKRFVQKHAARGPVCGVCQRIDFPYDACDTAQKDALTNLIKALVRFYYHEPQYNPHMGGESGPEILLEQQNPILECKRSASPNGCYDFLFDLFSMQPYPPKDQGIWVYGGHGDAGYRYLNRAMQGSESPLLTDLRERLANENPFDVEPAVDELLDLIGARIDRTIQAGATYFRARIGTENRWHRAAGWESEVLYEPYQAEQLGAPPPPMATSGRLNRAGVAFLYLASNMHTAAAEVRPHPGHRISIGQYLATRDLRIAAFDADIAAFSHNEHDLGLFHFIYSTDLTMARPVLPGATSRYTITQLIAECLRRREFDGVTFRSSVSDGENLCVFRPETFTYIIGSAEVKAVKRLAYTLEDAPTLLTPADGDYKLPS